MDHSDAAVAASARAAPFVPAAMFRAMDAKTTTTTSGGAGGGAGSSVSGARSTQREGRIVEEMDPQELRLKLFALFAETDKIWIQVCILGRKAFSGLALDVT